MLILKTISLSGKRFSHKKTIHKLGNKTLDTPKELKIVQYEGDKGYYLLYIDSSGNEITDTYHCTLIQALEQANYEFNIKNHEWISYKK